MAGNASAIWWLQTVLGKETQQQVLDCCCTPFMGSAFRPQNWNKSYTTVVIKVCEETKHSITATYIHMHSEHLPRRITS